MNYQTLTDEELIKRYRDGDDAAAEYLLMKYKRLVRARARTLYLTGADKDDLLQEGMLGLFKAIRGYKEGEASFPTFAALCISRQMFSAIKASESQKNIPLSGFVPIDDIDEDQTNIDMGISDNPERIFLDKEAAEVLRKDMLSVLSPFEKKVAELYLDGDDYKIISKKLDKSPKSVDNAIQRIKKKVSHLWMQSKNS